MSPLLAITPETYQVELEIRYATPDNFTGQPVYAKPLCYLHPDAAAALEKAVGFARHLGYGLRVYDAFRPSEAQWTLWEHTPDPDFLADPAKGSPHSRGVAVDLTLFDPVTHQPLDMGTAFDAFTPRSHHGALNISPEAHRNRILLLGIMTSAGWDFYRNEWWHYQLFNARAYPVLSDLEAGTGML
jgi:D-alanyl-D-alanine dipeptidase